MKRLLLFTGIIISLGTTAQNTDLVENYFNYQSKLKKDAFEKLSRDCFSKPRPAFTDIVPNQWGTTLNGEKVYRLPQDGMACIEPDLKQFNMPNAGAGMLLKKYGPGAIPNPGNKPDVKSVGPREK
jgi:hypothetical protein